MARILLINDEPDLLDICQLVLESAGHSVKTTTDSSHAAETVADDQPDVVLVDIVMPGTSGIEVLRRLRTMPRTSAIPVVVMSALVNAREQAEELGANGFLEKPFDPASLKGTVDQALGAARRPDLAPRTAPPARRRRRDRAAH